MLFNSLTFICIFLPIVLTSYWIIQNKFSIQWSLRFLTLASLFFYGFWKPVYLPLLLGSKAVNFCLNRLVLKNTSHRKIIFITCIVLNLGLLGVFKYTDFLIEIINSILNLSLPLPHLALPLGISFFTFQNIAYTVSVYKGYIKESNLERYAFFITFFPQLISGPIVKHEEFINQLDDLNQRPSHNLRQDLYAGLTAFTIGLFKKVVIADNLALAAKIVFDGKIFEEADYLSISAIEAWQGVFSYGFQLYFDFSGYSDMAIGLALLFGLRLPMNFNSPYKATSIIDFWRRWHITLSNFLRDYLYIPLGGNRLGKLHQLTNLMVTMLLGGLWHGAHWNFVIWGGIHGVMLVMNHLWNQLVSIRKLTEGKGWLAISLKQFYGLLTFMCVFLAWIPFRSPDLATVKRVFQAMIGQGNKWLESSLYAPIDFQIQIAGLIMLLWVVKVLPNTVEYLRNYNPVLETEMRTFNSKLIWSPNLANGIFIGILVFLIFKHFFGGTQSEFLYFNF